MTKQEFLKLQELKKYICIDKRTKEQKRFCREDDNYAFVFAKGKSRRGYRWSIDSLLAEYDVIIPSGQDADIKWHKRIKKVIKALSESGLWTDYKAKYENLYKMTLDDKREIYDLSWTKYREWQTPEKYNAEINKWIKKYPFISDGALDYKGYISIDTFYIYEMSECKTKSMYFGKYYNAQYKKEIQQAFDEKRSCRKSARTNYDVSFEYNAKTNCAWYSEEYKGCGNGHYYMALNNSMALFREDD